MVCVPCIFLPILLAIYLKFIQPFVLRILPEKWVTFLDPYLYPTCPAKPPPTATKENETGTNTSIRHRFSGPQVSTRCTVLGRKVQQSAEAMPSREDAAAACCSGKETATESKKDL